MSVPSLRGRARRCLPLLLATALAACGSSTAVSPADSGAATCNGLRMAVIPVSLTVAGEPATGLLYEPYRHTPGDLEPQDLIVFAHGHTDTAASFADILGPLSLRTATPLLTMDHRSLNSPWQPGAWNVWAGWQDTVAATQWYRQQHPQIRHTILWGWSQGGSTSGLALVHGPRGLYDYWVDSFGIVNAFVAWAGTSLVDPGFAAEIERDAGGCTPLQCPEAYISRSTVLNADRIDVQRAFVLHGLGDTTVPIEQAVEMRAALIANGVPVSSYTLSSARDADGQLFAPGHGVGPVADASVRVIERILAGSEPMAGPISEYLIDAASGIDTEPPAETFDPACTGS